MALIYGIDPISRSTWGTAVQLLHFSIVSTTYSTSQISRRFFMCLETAVKRIHTAKNKIQEKHPNQTPNHQTINPPNIIPVPHPSIPQKINLKPNT